MESRAAEEHAEAIPLPVVVAVMMYATHYSSPPPRPPTALPTMPRTEP